jgi:putative ABC transport system ATP-binding protein
VTPGELVGLVGRSGSGKSTLLNLLGGWEPPDAGEVRWNGGRAIPGWDHVAVIPQHLGLMPELSVRRNIEYPARLAGPGSEGGERVDELVEALGLGELQDRLPHEVSVGEQQRAALARALVLSPRVLLADEPTAHQDAGWTRAKVALLISTSRRGTACVVTTHDESVTAGLGRVLEMVDGVLAEPAVAEAPVEKAAPLPVQADVPQTPRDPSPSDADPHARWRRPSSE